MKNTVFWKVIFAILLAIVVGSFTGTDKAIGSIPYYAIFELASRLFLNALTLVVIPLVSSSIIVGIARMGADNSFGRLGIKTLGSFAINSFIAILVGWALALFFTSFQTPLTTSDLPSMTQAIQQEHPFQKFQQILLFIVPSNIFLAASQGQILGVIFFSLLFGFFISKIDSKLATTLLAFWKGVFEVMMLITQFFMRALPYGVFFLVAKVVALTGFESLKSVGWFLTCVVSGLIIHTFIILPLLLKAVAKVNPIKHLKAVTPALFTAFSTSSSSASLPITIESVEKRAGVSERISSLVLPLGTSISMSGTALYVCAAVLFIARAYGLEMSLSTHFLVILLALFTSLGMAGIPSASLFSIMIILTTIGLPAEAVALILAVERILDMCRTTVNVFGNTCCTVYVARSEGEKTNLQ